MIHESLRRLSRTVRGLAARAVVRGVVESGLLRTLQIEILAGELRDGVEHVESYGLTARPPVGAEAIVLHVGGDRSHPIVIATPDRRYRVTTLEAGEVSLHDDQGQRITLYRDRVEVEADMVVVNAVVVELGTGALEPAVLGQTLAAWLDTHTHTVTTAPGTTSPPTTPSPPAALSEQVSVS